MTEHSIQAQAPSQQLDTIESSLSTRAINRLYQILQNHDLHFIALPSASTAPEVLPLPNVLKLDPYFPKNKAAIDHEEMLGRHSQIITALSNVPLKGIQSRVDTCAAPVQAEAQFFLNWKRQEWKHQLLMAREVLTADPSEFLEAHCRCLTQVAILP
jgi:hypothetical protein